MIEYDAEKNGPIPPDAKATHHITEDMVRPGADNVFERGLVLNDMIAAETPDMVYAAHNAKFDIGFLPEIANRPDAPRWICTWRCAMHLWQDAPSHKNQTLRYWLGEEPAPEMLHLDGPVRAYPPTLDGTRLLCTMDGLVPLAPHRAQYDTAVTAAILRRMLRERTVEQLVELSTKPVLQSTCRFGKHRGKEWSEIPTDYLRWMQRSSDFYRDDADIRYTVDRWLAA